MIHISSISTFINEYFPGASISQRISIIKDLYNGKGLKYYKKRYITKEALNSGYIDWKKRYETSNYMNLLVDEFIEFIPYIDEVQGISSTSDRTIERKQDLFDKWLDKSNWKSLCKNIAKERKLSGDVYVHWWIAEDDDGFRYPKFKKFDSEYMTMKSNEDENIEAYIWEKDISWQEKIQGDTLNYQSKSKTITYEFLRGKTNIYENGILESTEVSDPKYIKEFQLIHLQYLKQENSNYSVIPCESLVDGCLRMDKIETSISTTNLVSGSPTLVVKNGKLTQGSSFGENGILYIESEDETGNLGCEWGQLEITNGLESKMSELEQVVNMLYKRANLVQPKLVEKLTTTDSSKVVSSIRVNLENEIEDFFLELQKKFKLPLRILYEENDELAKKDDIELKIPTTLINMSKFDEYLLMAQEMSLGIRTVRDNIKDTGKTVEQTNKKIDQLNKEQVGGKDDISIKSTSSNNEQAKENAPNLDNNLK